MDLMTCWRQNSYTALCCTSFSVFAVRKHSSVQTEIYWYCKNLWLYCEFC